MYLCYKNMLHHTPIWVIPTPPSGDYPHAHLGITKMGVLE